MAQTKLKALLETYASAVAYVEVKDEKEVIGIGSAFHIGEGVFVTARHVIENKEILRVVTKRSTYQPSPDIPGALMTVHASGSGTLKGAPLFHPDDHTDVALLLVDGIDAPSIPLGAHLDDWLGNEFTLCSVLVMGYPVIPFSKEALLVAATGEVNAVVEKYTGGHPHFILSTMARGGFSGGPVLTEYGSALGLVTESLINNEQPAELGYHAVLTVEPIYSCLKAHGVMPQCVHDAWRSAPGEKSFWESSPGK